MSRNSPAEPRPGNVSEARQGSKRTAPGRLGGPWPGNHIPIALATQDTDDDRGAGPVADTCFFPPGKHMIELQDRPPSRPRSKGATPGTRSHSRQSVPDGAGTAARELEEFTDVSARPTRVGRAACRSDTRWSP